MHQSSAASYPCVRQTLGAGLFPLLMFFCLQTATAQSCGPASVFYVIRDAQGHFMDASTLAPSSFVKESVEDYGHTTRKIYFSNKGDILPGSDAKDVTPVTSLTYAGGANCRLKLNELTLKIDGKTMRLIFNLSLNSQSDYAHSRKVIDSLPFQEGTFTLETTSENNIPATAWKQVKQP
jgi:hypothetical protein